MDIHRCRFVPYPPQPVNAIAFSHKSDLKHKSPSDLRLALGRSNGDIEIWNPLNGNWIQEIVLKGRRSTTIEQIVWTQDVTAARGTDQPTLTSGTLRLFSTGGSTIVTEWDLNMGTPKRQVEGNFGEIWCFAAQPQIDRKKDINALGDGTASQLLAAGCINGTIILFSTEDDDLRYVQSLPGPLTKKPKVLSLTWRDRKTIVAGYEDSTIRVIDVPSRKIVQNMTLGKSVEKEEIVVWSVKCLPDGTIISGDSTGELKIWDSKTFSLLQQLKTHEADILDIVTNAAGDMIFSLGVDRRTVSYKPVSTAANSKTTRWAEVFHRRYHKHDVKCAATFESSEMSVLVSGGMDATPIVTPIRRWQSEKHRSLPHLPQKPQISSSQRSRLFISWWDCEIAVYQLSHRRPLIEDSYGVEVLTPPEPSHETLTKIVLKSDENLQDAQISVDGQFVVATTINQVRLFQLRKTFVSGRPVIRTRPVELPTSIARLGGRFVGFSPDGKWLYVVRKDNAIVLAKIVQSDDTKAAPTIYEKTTKLYRQSRPYPETALGTYPQTITQVTFSSDSRVLAVGDISGVINIWLLEGHEDPNFIETLSDHSDSASATSSSDEDDDEDEDISPVIHSQKWICNPSGSGLPKLDSAILTLTFRPLSHSLIPQTPSKGNVGLHATRHNPHPVSHELPATGVNLIALTATHQLIEFDVLTSSLSDWARRNPSQYLPPAFTRLKDRVVGCFWDVGDRQGRGERLWLYGHNYLFMLDLSRDLPRNINKSTQNHSESLPRGEDKQLAEKRGRLGKYDVLGPIENGVVEQSPNNKKNSSDSKKRQPPLLESTSPEQDHVHETKKRRRRHSHHHQPDHKGTGAGSQIKPSERLSGLGSTVRKFKNADEDEEMVDIDGVDDMDADIENDDNIADDTLVAMRRKDTMDVEDETQNPPPAHGGSPRPHYWYTFAYNSILGVGVIGTVAEAEDASTHPSALDSGHPEGVDEDAARTGPVRTRGQKKSRADNIEVVIVERSMFDVEGQMPRFDGQVWDV